MIRHTKLSCRSQCTGFIDFLHAKFMHLIKLFRQMKVTECILQKCLLQLLLQSIYLIQNCNLLGCQFRVALFFQTKLRFYCHQILLFHPQIHFHFIEIFCQQNIFLTMIFSHFTGLFWFRFQIFNLLVNFISQK